MNDKYYKIIDVGNRITTIYTNNAYDIMHICNRYGISGVSANYKTDDINKINLSLLSDLFKTNNDLNRILYYIDELVKNNVISQEVAEYLYSSIYPQNDEQYTKNM